MKLMMIVALCLCLAQNASALEIAAPEVPESGQPWFSENTDSFADALWEMVGRVLSRLGPELRQAAKVGVGIVATAMLTSLAEGMHQGLGPVLRVTGTAAVAASLLRNSQIMIALGENTLSDIGSYGMALLQVMAGALAAQGGVSTSAALYAGSALFLTLLTKLVSGILMPMLHLFLALGAGGAATGEELLKKLRELTKKLMSWCLKTLLTVFTTYLSITGIVSGTTDAAALKAARVTISSVVPMVGGILSDASEAVLVSTGVLKNAAGIYGILAVLAVSLYPFARIGMQYLILKLSAAVCAVFSGNWMTELIDCFSSAMGFVLAMTGSSCIMVLVSTVCFLRGVG